LPPDFFKEEKRTPLLFPGTTGSLDSSIGKVINRPADYLSIFPNPMAKEMGHF
jgi:hypothetical protein